MFKYVQRYRCDLGTLDAQGGKIRQEMKGRIWPLLLMMVSRPGLTFALGLERTPAKMETSTSRIKGNEKKAWNECSSVRRSPMGICGYQQRRWQKSPIEGGRERKESTKPPWTIFFYVFNLFPFFKTGFTRIWVYVSRPPGVDVHPSKKVEQGGNRETRNEPDPGLFAPWHFSGFLREASRRTRETRKVRQRSRSFCDFLFLPFFWFSCRRLRWTANREAAAEEADLSLTAKKGKNLDYELCRRRRDQSHFFSGFVARDMACFYPDLRIPFKVLRIFALQSDTRDSDKPHASSTYNCPIAVSTCQGNVHM